MAQPRTSISFIKQKLQNTIKKSCKQVKQFPSVIANESLQFISANAISKEQQ